MKLNFVERLDRKAFDITQGAWLAQIEENKQNVSEAYYAAGLEYCSRVVEGDARVAGDGCVCALVEEGCAYASALIVVLHARARDEVRMLDLYVQPSLNLADQGPNTAALAWIAARVLIDCLNMTYATYPAETLKLHTAFPLNREFMAAVTTVIFASADISAHYDVSSQGNWLVVKKKPGCPSHIVIAD